MVGGIRASGSLDWGDANGTVKRGHAPVSRLEQI
jgi:hypothetical protein